MTEPGAARKPLAPLWELIRDFGSLGGYVAKAPTLGALVAVLADVGPVWPHKAALCVLTVVAQLLAFIAVLLFLPSIQRSGRTVRLGLAALSIVASIWAGALYVQQLADRTKISPNEGRVLWLPFDRASILEERYQELENYRKQGYSKEQWVDDLDDGKGWDPLRVWTKSAVSGARADMLLSWLGLTSLLCAVFALFATHAVAGGPPVARWRVLAVFASPENDRLSFDREMRSITQSTDAPASIDLKLLPACKVSDFGNELLKKKRYTLLHFGGHSEDGRLVFVDPAGDLVAADIGAVADAVKEHESIECIVLTACSTAEEARQLASVADCVVGMSHPISDECAAVFSDGFYAALGEGKSPREAMEEGHRRLRMNPVEDPEPVYFESPGDGVSEEAP